MLDLVLSSVNVLFGASVQHCADALVALQLGTSGMLSSHTRDIAAGMSKCHNTLDMRYDPEPLATSRRVRTLLSRSNEHLLFQNIR